jgi:hypothetical protein
MYAFTPGQPLRLVYEDFYLAIGYTFHEIINVDGVVKSPISVLRLISRDLRRLNLELLTLPSRFDFLS